MFVDTHAHLFYPNFNEDLEEVINRSFENGVDYIIVPGTDLASSAQAVTLSEKYENIYATIGVHPHDSKDLNGNYLNDLETLATNKKVVAIGEIGLDYYYDFSPKEKQLKVFEDQIILALKLNLPVVVHNRESNDDVMRIIRSYKDSGLKCQFHCFAGTIQDAKELIEMRHYLSFTGNITFKKADTLREIVKSIQADNLLLESDSPFMTPVPHRGLRNEPSNVKLVAEKIAEIQNLSLEDVANSTSLNAFKLFGIGKMPELTFTYKIRNSLYINVTNRCNADCVFCDRKGDATVKGYNLKMTKSQEPPAEIYIKEIGDPKNYDEIVFCGFGEPTIRWDVCKEIAAYVKANGGKTRINTDGHGNVINKRDITPEFKGLIDEVSISLNSTDKVQYANLMRVAPEMFDEMIDFAKKVKEFSRLTLSVVGLDEIDKEKAKKFAEEVIGANFRERTYFS